LLSDAFVIVTSRRQLTRLHAWKGARRLRVEPMSVAESSTLLTRRIGHRHLPAGSDPTELAALCRGIPLVVNLVAEYAAARPRTGLPELTEQLRRDRSLLTIGEDGDTHASLQTLFSYSYRALPPPERRLFGLLGCHPGPDISEAAATAIDGRPTRDTRRSLDMLVSSHLLDQPGRGRLRFHDLIGEYARHVAVNEEPAIERVAAERRLLSFYLASARNAERRVFPSHSGPPPLAVEEHVEPLEFGDPRSAMAWCIEERFNLDAAIRFADTYRHDTYAWRIPHAVSAIYERLGLYAQRMAVLEIAAAAAQRAEDSAAEAASWQQLGLVHLALNDFSSAQQCLLRALRIAERNKSDGEGYALHSLARLKVAQGAVADGIELYEQCLAVARRTGNLDIQCWTHQRLGEALRVQGHLDQALLELHRAHWLAGTIDDTSAQAVILTTLGEVFLEKADYVAADVYCRQALKVIVDIGYVAAGARVCAVLAALSRARGNRREACQFARQCVSINRRLNNIEGLATGLEMLAEIHVELGNKDAAEEGLEQAADLFRRIAKFDRAESVRAKLVELLFGNRGRP
jgi:tetratricopeptide (TPR) repeat protein